MLVVRLQRRGRKKLPLYRIVVQDSHSHPTSGKVVAYLGSYNPHSKQTEIDTDKAMAYINNGAQPSERVVRLLLAQKAKLPKWVKQPDSSRSRDIRNPEKLRKNQPAEEEPTQEEEAPAQTPAEESTAEADTSEEKTAEEPETSEPNDSSK